MKIAEGNVISSCLDCPHYAYVYDWDSSLNDTSWCDADGVDGREIMNPHSIPKWCPLPDLTEDSE